MFVLIGFMGIGDAFFNPAVDGPGPDLLGPDDLVQANAFGGMMRPLMLRFLGPATGGFLVAGLGPGWSARDGAPLRARGSLQSVLPILSSPPRTRSDARGTRVGLVRLPRHHSFPAGRFRYSGDCDHLFTGDDERPLVPLRPRHLRVHEEILTFLRPAR